MRNDRTPPATLRTRRLALRSPVAADAARMAELASDLDVARMTTALPYPFSVDQALDFIQRMDAADARTEVAFSMITPSGEFMGLVGCHPDGSGGVELGYWLGRPFWGFGYMTEAVSATLDWAAGGWRKRYLMSGHFIDNPASAGVLVKAGFLYTGETRSRRSLVRHDPIQTRMMVWLA